MTHNATKACTSSQGSILNTGAIPGRVGGLGQDTQVRAGKAPPQVCTGWHTLLCLADAVKRLLRGQFPHVGEEQGRLEGLLQEVLLLSCNLAAELMSHVELCAAFLMQSSCQALPHDDCTVGAIASVV